MNIKPAANGSAKTPKRGRPRIRSDEERAQAARDRLQRFRASGERLDLKLPSRAVRQLDSMCSRCKATRNQFLEALLDALSEAHDLTAISARIEHMKEDRE